MLDLLVIAPHPDDGELGCGGTLARAKAEGLSTGILDLTQGEMGSKGPQRSGAERRRRQAAFWAWTTGETWVCLTVGCTMGRSNVWPWPGPSGRFGRGSFWRPSRPTVTQTTRWRAAWWWRRYILRPFPRHPREASPDGAAFLLSGKPPGCAAFINVWERAVLAYRSQFSGEDVSETVGPKGVEARKALRRHWGSLAKVDYAEGFLSPLPILATPWAR